MLNFEFQGNRKLRDEVTSSRLNAILTELRRIRPVAGRGINIQQESNGVRISALDQAGGSLASSQAHPFQINLASDPAQEGRYLATVRPGTLNGVIASNWQIQEAINEETLRYVILTATASSNYIESTELSFSSSPPNSEQSPVKWALPGQFTVVIGLVRPPQSWQIVYDNLSFAGAKRITTDRPSPMVGQLPYDNWYVWQQ